MWELFLTDTGVKWVICEETKNKLLAVSTPHPTTIKNVNCFLFLGFLGITHLSVHQGSKRAFCFSILQVPKEWKLDSDWDREQLKQPQQLSHLRDQPSKWSAASAQQDPLSTVKIVDHFVIHQTDKPSSVATNGSAVHWSLAFVVCSKIIHCNFHV